VSFASRIQGQSFAYDWLGNTTATSDDAGGFYDRSIGVITNGTATAGPYQLQSATNVPTTGGSALASQGSLTVAYDLAGNMTSMAVTRSGACLPAGALCSQRYAYSWDEVGRLARARRWDVATPGSASSALPTTTAEADLRYTYDATDDRTIKAAYDASGDVVYTVYPLDPLELRGAAWDADAGDYERTTATQAAYLFAHGVRLGRIATAANGDDPSLTDAAWHLFLELPDHLGSTSTVIDAETGELVEEGTYQAYGSAESDYRPERWDSFREDYRFTGKEEDIQVGLQYFGKRYYAPALGRWLSADPLAIHDLGSDLNVYAYVHGSVFRSVDPTGLQNVQPDNSPSYAGPPTLEEVKQAEANRQAESQKHRAELEAQGPMGKMDLWFEKHPSVYKVAENLYLLVQVVSVSHDLNQLLEGGSSLFQSGVAGRATSTPASEAF
jgi:RHS repeat-associated protein